MRFQTPAALRAFGLIAVLAVAGLSSAGTRAAPPLPFDTMEAGHRMLADERRFDGEVEAVHRSTISAQTAGEIIELPFDVNDYVPKGEVVLRLDDSKQQATLEQAQANVIEARVRLSEAQSAHRRNLRLIKEDAVSQSAVEKTQANLKAAEARLKQAQAALDEAQEQLDYTVVKAPYAGVLIERFVEIGEQVQVGEPLGTGLSLEKLRVKVEVPARYVEAIRTGAAPRVLVPGEGQHWIEARDHVVFPYADPRSHTFTVRVQLPEGQHGLYPGMLVKVAFPIGQQRELVVPSAAIVHRSEVTGVYVVDSVQRVQFRQIREGREVPGGLTIVMAGLEAGERVALDPIAAVIYLKQQHGRPADE